MPARPKHTGTWGVNNTIIHNLVRWLVGRVGQGQSHYNTCTILLFKLRADGSKFENVLKTIQCG